MDLTEAKKKLSYIDRKLEKDDRSYYEDNIKNLLKDYRSDLNFYGLSHEDFFEASEACFSGTKLSEETQKKVKRNTKKISHKKENWDFNFESEGRRGSLSVYYINEAKTKVLRISDHWTGRGGCGDIRSCRWTLSSMSTFDFKGRKMKAGICEFSKMYNSGLKEEIKSAISEINSFAKEVKECRDRQANEIKITKGYKRIIAKALRRGEKDISFRVEDFGSEKFVQVSGSDVINKQGKKINIARYYRDSLHFGHISDVYAEIIASRVCS